MADIKAWISSHGPVVTCFTVYDDFFSYSSGVYHYVSGAVAGGHCVCVVGDNDLQHSIRSALDALGAYHQPEHTSTFAGDLLALGLHQHGLRLRMNFNQPSASTSDEVVGLGGLDQLV